MAWASRRIRTTQLLSNWLWVYLGNLIGALGGLGAVGERAIRIAYAKAMLDPFQAFARGILCNVLVCLAVWLCMGARSMTDKILAIVFPITAFVACGFEHSIANMYFVSTGFILTWGASESLPLVPALLNLVVVTLGNILGGTVLVALVYWFIYLRESGETRETRKTRLGLFSLFRSS
jgi:formate/nitrite transporter